MEDVLRDRIALVDGLRCNNDGMLTWESAARISAALRDLDGLRARLCALADEYERNAELMRVSLGDDLITRQQAFEDAASTIRRALEPAQ